MPASVVLVVLVAFVALVPLTPPTLLKPSSRRPPSFVLGTGARGMGGGDGLGGSGGRNGGGGVGMTPRISCSKLAAADEDAFPSCVTLYSLPPWNRQRRPAVGAKL